MSEPIDWNALTPAQRNALIAEKVMGWKSKECDGEIGEQPISPDGWRCQKCGEMGYWGDDYTHEEKPRRYSESMDAAWLIVNKQRGAVLNAIETVDRRGPLCCDATLFFAVGGECRVYAATMPEAICIAALRAVGIEVQQET